MIVFCDDDSELRLSMFIYLFIYYFSLQWCYVSLWWHISKSALGWYFTVFVSLRLFTMVSTSVVVRLPCSASLNPRCVSVWRHSVTSVYGDINPLLLVMSSRERLYSEIYLTLDNNMHTLSLWWLAVLVLKRMPSPLYRRSDPSKVNVLMDFKVPITLRHLYTKMIFRDVIHYS